MSTTVIALNIFDGMNLHQNYKTFAAAYEQEGMGFMEFCGWIEIIATKITPLRDRLEHTGVWEYEVCCPLGTQIAFFMKMKDAMPTEGEVLAWAQTLHNKFRGHDQSTKGPAL